MSDSDEGEDVDAGEYEAAAAAAEQLAALDGATVERMEVSRGAGVPGVPQSYGLPTNIHGQETVYSKG